MGKLNRKLTASVLFCAPEYTSSFSRLAFEFRQSIESAFEEIWKRKDILFCILVFLWWGSFSRKKRKESRQEGKEQAPCKSAFNTIGACCVFLWNNISSSISTTKHLIGLNSWYLHIHGVKYIGVVSRKCPSSYLLHSPIFLSPSTQREGLSSFEMVCILHIIFQKHMMLVHIKMKRLCKRSLVLFRHIHSNFWI